MVDEQNNINDILLQTTGGGFIDIVVFVQPKFGRNYGCLMMETTPAKYGNSAGYDVFFIF